MVSCTQKRKKNLIFITPSQPTHRIKPPNFHQISHYITTLVKNFPRPIPSFTNLVTRPYHHTTSAPPPLRDDHTPFPASHPPPSYFHPSTLERLLPQQNRRTRPVRTSLVLAYPHAIPEPATVVWYLKVPPIQVLRYPRILPTFSRRRRVFSIKGRRLKD